MAEFENGTPESMDNVEKEEKKQIDVLVVFGAGIQSDQDLEKMDWARTEDEGEKLATRRRLPLVAKLRTVAAAELFLSGEVRDVILTGGKVKSSEGIEESEAELMADYFEQIVKKRWAGELKRRLFPEGESRAEILDPIRARIDEEVDRKWQEVSSRIKLEDKATNTIENFAHTVNYLDENKEENQSIALLSNEFHMDRIMKLADRLQVEGEGIGAEAVMRERSPHYARLIKKYFDLEGNNNYRTELQRAISTEQDEAGFIDKWNTTQEKMRGTFESALKGEIRWSRGLDKIPQYWLANIRFIQDIERLQKILKAQKQIEGILKEKGIESIDLATQEELSDAVASVERQMPPREWEDEKAAR